MTRKDFELIADGLAAGLKFAVQGNEALVNAAAHAMAMRLRESNTSFNTKRFIDKVIELWRSYENR